MRFVLAISEISANGPSGSRLRIARGLASRGHEVEVLSLTGRVEREIPADVNVHFLRPDLKRFPPHYPARLLLSRALRSWFRRQCDLRPIDFFSSSLTSTDRIVHMSGIDDCFYWLHIATSQLLAEAHSPRRAARRRRFFRSLYEGKRVIGVSQGVIDDLAALPARPEEAVVLHNSYDIEAIRRRAALEQAGIPEEPFVLHVGRFASAKRFDILLKAFAAGTTREKLVLLTPETPELTALIGKADLSKRVVVAGFQENPFPYMSKAAALVLSSDREGFPNVLVEALICGTPVVSTDCLAGPSEILTGPFARWLSPPGDAEALGQNLRSVLAEPYATTELIRGSYHLSHTLDRLEELAASGRPPRLGRMKPFP
ncbi:glycosyltransferase [Consotaella salsifontis]|nr:glycosyltransferase [Consotaella salsifontis]